MRLGLWPEVVERAPAALGVMAALPCRGRHRGGDSLSQLSSSPSNESIVSVGIAFRRKASCHKKNIFSRTTCFEIPGSSNDTSLLLACEKLFFTQDCNVEKRTGCETIVRSNSTSVSFKKTNLTDLFPTTLIEQKNSFFIVFTAAGKLHRAHLQENSSSKWFGWEERLSCRRFAVQVAQNEVIRLLKRSMLSDFDNRRPRAHRSGEKLQDDMCSRQVEDEGGAEDEEGVRSYCLPWRDDNRHYSSSSPSRCGLLGEEVMQPGGSLSRWISMI